MTTYLEGVQNAARECGLRAVPSTVTNQTGEFGDFVRWYADAWTELQNEDYWRWMRREFTLDTVASTAKYAYTSATDVVSGSAISRFKAWRFEDRDDPPRAYLKSSGVGTESYMVWLPWEHFRTLYRFGTTPTGSPSHITVDPQDNIRLGPTPDAVYTVSGEYWRSPQTLSANTDTPEMPAHFHNLIMYRTMEKYGFFEAANEVVQRAQAMGMKLKHQLVEEQGPRWSLADPMI